jgi:protein-S-isoprenylcysteine O-methyltransferase Ste14
VSSTSWWKGARGEWYVVIQGGLLALVVFGPHTWNGWLARIVSEQWLSYWCGGVLLLGGCILSVSGVLRLGKNITAVPYPKDNAVLVETGPYQFVRHPIYSGLILSSLGWGWFVNSWLTLGYAMLLFAFLDIKSRREERWLKERFANYSSYQKRVHKLIPFVY